jgi:outer membrane protein assembly factor BamB
MLKKLILIAITSSLLVACAAEKEKVKLKGTRITIKPEQTILMPDPELISLQVIIPEQINYQDWTQTGGFADHSPLHPKIDTMVKKAWKKSIGKSLKDYQSFTSSPIIFNNVLYTVNTNNEIVALNAQTGKKLWDLQLDSELDSDQVITPGALAIDGANLVAVLGTGDLYTINIIDKKIIWHKNLNQPIRSAPTISEGQVFISSLNNKLSVFDINNGNLIWTHSGLNERLTILGDSSPAVAQNIVVVTYSSGEIYALDLKTGGEIWSDSINNNNSFEISENILDVVASPVIVGNLLHIVNYNGKLTTYNLKTGKKYWARNLSSVTTPWIAGNSIFIVSENGLLTCVYRKTGQVKWVVDLKKVMLAKLDDDEKNGATFTAPFLAGNRLIVGSNKGYIASFDPKNGNISAYVDIKESISVNPIVANGSIYFLTDESNIIAYSKANK